MKTTATNYSFDPALGEISILGYPKLEQRHILIVNNSTRNSTLYLFNSSGSGGTLNGNVLRLTKDCSGMASTDQLYIILDVPDESTCELLGECAGVTARGSEGVPLQQVPVTNELATLDSNLATVLGGAPLHNDRGSLRVQSSALQLKTTQVIAIANSAATLMFEGMASVAVQLAGTWAGTITFEATTNGGDWTSIIAHRVDGQVIAGATTTAAGIYRICATGLVGVRARFSAYTSGIATVTIAASPVASYQPLAQLVSTSRPDIYTQDTTVNTTLGTLTGTVRPLMWGYYDTPYQGNAAFTPAAPTLQTSFSSPALSGRLQYYSHERAQISGSCLQPIAQLPNTNEMQVADLALFRLMEELQVQIYALNRQLAVFAGGNDMLELKEIR